MSDLEKRAREWANEFCPGQDDADIPWHCCYRDYIAGAKAERERILNEAASNLWYAGLKKELIRDGVKLIAIEDLERIVKGED